MARENKNIIILKNLSELNEEINFNDFEYKKYFKLLCNLIPNIEKEKLDIEVIDNENINIKGLVYVFVIDEKIFKIGETITTIKERVSSYNCGKIEYRINGTNSTTNYFILQSLLKINKIVNVYAFFPEQPKYKLFGKEYQSSYPPVKTAENIIIKDFIKKYGKKPIGCSQT